MRYKCTLKQLFDGQWQARTEASEAGPLQSRAHTAEEAIETLRGAIRYRMETCPRSGVADDSVELEVEELKPSRWRGSVF